MHRSWLALAALPACLLNAPVARAQTFALDEDKPNVLWMEIQRPAFRGDQYLSAWLGIVGVRYQFASQLSVLAGLPFAQATIAAHQAGGVAVPAVTNSLLGNPYFGLRFGLPWQTVAMDVVVGVPLGQARYASFSSPFVPPDAAGLAGAEGDWDRFEAFEGSGYWSGRVAALLSRHVSGSVDVRLRAGAAFVRGKDIPIEVAAAVTYRQSGTLASAGLTFRSRAGDIVGAPGGSGGPGPIQATLGLGFPSSRTVPTVFVRVPLRGSIATDPLARYVFGVCATLQLGGPHSGF